MCAHSPLLNDHLQGTQSPKGKNFLFLSQPLCQPQFSLYNGDQHQQVSQQKTCEIHRYHRDDGHGKAQGESNWFALKGTI